jgi:hypothetical protein
MHVPRVTQLAETKPRLNNHCYTMIEDGVYLFILGVIYSVGPSFKKDAL